MVKQLECLQRPARTKSQSCIRKLLHVVRLTPRRHHVKLLFSFLELLDKGFAEEVLNVFTVFSTTGAILILFFFKTNTTSVLDNSQ